MGAFDELLSQVTGSLSGNATGQPGLVNSVLGMLTSNPGGLQGVIQTMREKGLGGIADSWVGTGANHAISAEQIQQVLGNEKLRELAAQHGLNVDELSAHLAQILPAAVDKLTPNGTLPTGGGLGDLVKGFMSKATS